MRNNIMILMITVLLAVTSCSFTTKKFDADSDKDRVLIELMMYVLERGHFDLREVDDEFSEQVFEDFIQALDPLKRHFLQEDIDDFEEYRFLIDDQIKNQEFDFFDLAYNRLQMRIKDAKAIYPKLLDTSFNFEEDEEIDTDYEKLPYAETKAELQDRWKKQLKFSALGTYYDMLDTQNKKLEKLSEKNQDEETDTADEIEVEEDFKPQSLEELEREARTTTRESIETYFENTNDIEREDWFGLYINSVASQFDPHTNYFAPQDKDRFDVSMSGKLEGIGARLRKERDQVKIDEVISGGPAWKDGQLETGDLIQRVRQEDEAESVSIIGMRLDDAVDLIKGKKGTKVILTVKKVDGSIEEIELVRDIVEIDETYAKTSLVEKEQVKYGVINLPKFYFDMQDYNQRNAASDMKKEVLRLIDEGAEGLVIDLRNNGGGSLSTVVDIAGLFIESGPVVQVKSSDGDKDVLKDKDSKIVWDGPLVIMVNEISASASEILAAAMQDYERAIIMGSEQTYGKGTVQNLVDLNRWMKGSKFGDMGALKLTTQKFYRVNGGSTQLKGVSSDIVMPDRYMYIDLGERDYDNPLAWDKITPAKFEKWKGYKNIESVIQASKERIASNEQLSLIEENAKWVELQRERNVFPLHIDLYAAHNQKIEEKAKKFKKINDYETKLEYISLPYELEAIEKDSSLGEKRERWHKNLKKDVYVEEAINVLEDLRKQTVGSKLVKAN
ncbi:carboxy terminal-processing peptidase [Psychroflexus maritimus]|uniref:Carboxy terminal-processing peptidase n=1 Tax=Psychroflexus maritimus TaxID=2714865 RepID=A0A967AJS4_9FLAO|nr:carboxy terminal-processing peptidase [Psychroflexus maritimus]NGZ90600.1 carboxy terminal-processing peptidase [Psychroflexus maritimus]